MKPIANRARSVNVIRRAAVLADCDDPGHLGAPSHQAHTELGLRSSRCGRHKSQAFAGNLMYFLGYAQGAAFPATAGLQRVEPFHRLRIGAVRWQAARRSACLR